MENITKIQKITIDWDEIKCLVVTVPNDVSMEEIDKIANQLKEKPTLIIIREGCKVELLDKK